MDFNESKNTIIKQYIKKFYGVDMTGGQFVHAELKTSDLHRIATDQGHTTIVPVTQGLVIFTSETNPQSYLGPAFIPWQDIASARVLGKPQDKKRHITLQLITGQRFAFNASDSNGRTMLTELLAEYPEVHDRGQRHAYRKKNQVWALRHTVFAVSIIFFAFALSEQPAIMYGFVLAVFYIAWWLLFVVGFVLLDLLKGLVLDRPTAAALQQAKLLAAHRDESLAVLTDASVQPVSFIQWLRHRTSILAHAAAVDEQLTLLTLIQLIPINQGAVKGFVHKLGVFSSIPTVSQAVPVGLSFGASLRTLFGFERRYYDLLALSTWAVAWIIRGISSFTLTITGWGTLLTILSVAGVAIAVGFIYFVGSYHRMQTLDKDFWVAVKRIVDENPMKEDPEKVAKALRSLKGQARTTAGKSWYDTAVSQTLIAQEKYAEAKLALLQSDYDIDPLYEQLANVERAQHFVAYKAERQQQDDVSMPAGDQVDDFY